MNFGSALDSGVEVTSGWSICERLDSFVCLDITNYTIDIPLLLHRHCWIAGAQFELVDVVVLIPNVHVGCTVVRAACETFHVHMTTHCRASEGPLLGNAAVSHLNLQK